MGDDLYRLIPEDGKHLADSHDTEGAYRGVYLDDETNKPCGAGEFVKVDISELTASNDINNNNDNGISFEQAAGIAVISATVGVVTTIAYPHIKKFVLIKIAPPVKRFCNTKIRKKKAKNAIDCKSENTELSIDVVLEEYRENMSSYEAKKELVEAFVLQVIAARKIKRVAQANIVYESGRKVEKREFVDKLANPALITEINTILSANPQLDPVFIDVSKESKHEKW